MSGAFAGRTARWLAAVAGLSLAASALLGVFGDAFEASSSGADAFSRSALGHRALAELWRALGHRVLVSRHRTATKLSDDAVLVVAEPLELFGRAGAEKLSEMLAASSRALLVLPKRMGAPDPLRPGWIGRQFTLPREEAARVLAAAGIEGEVVRPGAVTAWQGGGLSPSLPEPQLVRAAGLAPLVSCAEGILVGVARRERGELVVVADPDLVANHGLGRGDNAALAELALGRLTGGGDASVVIDETLHGHEQEPSLARELLRWPLVPATLQAAFALLLVGWAALVRFGRPRREAPALAPGKAFLVENTADLLRQGGHGGAALAAYWRAAKEQMAHRLRLRGEGGLDVDARLARLAAARGRSPALAALERRVAALSQRRGGAELARAALAIHHFREEMTNGSDPHP